MIIIKSSKKANLNMINIEHKYFSYDSIKDTDEESVQVEREDRSLNTTLRGQISTPEFLHEIHEPGVPPHELRLMESAICVLMRNLTLEEGLVKNARVVIKKLLENVIEVELVGVEAARGANRKRYHLPRIMFEFQPRFCSWTMQRKEFPLRLAYATTFNSCQGLTLDRAVIDLRVAPFTHGQLYTSISRVRHRDHIRSFFNTENERGITTNIVYKDLLLLDD